MKRRPILILLLALTTGLTPSAVMGQTPARPPASPQTNPANPTRQPAPANAPTGLLPSQAPPQIGQLNTPRQYLPGAGVLVGLPAPNAGTPPSQSLPGAGTQSGVPQPTPSGKPGPPDRVQIYSDKAIYRRKEKRAEAIGHVKIIQDNTTVYADQVLYNEATKQSQVDSGVKIVQVNKTKDKGRTTTITAGKMTAYHEERRMLLREDVRMDREAAALPEPADYAVSKAEKRARTERALEKARSVITADQMEYFTRTEDANLDGNVVVLQKDKQVTGDKAVIKGEKNGDMITVDGHAKVNQINGNWLVQNKIIKPDAQDEEQQRLLHEKMMMDADKITLHRATDDMEAQGNVKITQKVGGKERVAVGKEATYSDKQQLATLTGDVKIQRENGDWLTADKVLYHTDTETFEAFGGKDQVISIFTIYDEQHPEPKEPINPAIPENNLDQHKPGQRLPDWLKNRQEPDRAPSKPGSATPAQPVPSAQPTPRPNPQPSPRPTTAPGPGPNPNPSGAPSSAPSQPPTPTPSPVAGHFTIQPED